MPVSLVAHRARAGVGRRVRTLAAYLLLAAACFAAGFALAPAPEDPIDTRWPSERIRLPKPVLLGEFSLRVAGGEARAFTRENLVGRWTLMYFGYSHCPDVCRPTLEMLSHTARTLAARHPELHVQHVFVGVDPPRDTPARLRDYASRVDAGIVALHGNETEIAGLARQAGILYARRRIDESGSYVVDHPATILLIDPSARLRAGFPPPHDAARIVKEIVELEPAFGSGRTH